MSIDDVTDIAPRVQYASSASQTAFDYPFPIFDDADLVVDVDGVTKTLTTDYTVSGAGDDNGGTVTFVTGQTSGAIVTIYRDTAIERTTDFQQNGPWSSAAFNDELDKITVILQELSSKIGRAIRFPITSLSTNAQAEMSPISTFFGKFLRISSTGILEAAEVTDSVVTLTAEVIGALLNPRTQAEIDEDVTVVAYRFAEGWVDRYGLNSVPGGTTDMSAAIQAAIDVGRSVHFLKDTYAANNLVADNNYQVFFVNGAVISKNGNNPIITFSADRNVVRDARFAGNGGTYTGHNVVKSGNHLVLDQCSSTNAAGRAVYDSNGNGLRIIGTNDIYQTADSGGTGYDIEVAGSGLYCKITDIYTSQATGGIYFNQSGSGGGHSVMGGQLGKLTFVGGSGASAVSNCRINGDITIQKSGVSIDISSCSANVTLGDGSTTFTGITIGHGFHMQSGTTFTATAGLQDCTLYVDQLQDNGVTVDYSALAVDNWLYTARVAYTSAWTAASSNPAIVDGTIGAYYQRSGRKVRVWGALTFGASTTYGTGVWRHGLPFTVAADALPMGVARAFDSGTNFRIGAFIPQPGLSYATSIFDSAATETTSAVPFTFASGDSLYFDAEYYAG